jgi:NAD(P)-dependent dehydrogenase (short-subunit alcohol dehydrogenase family)
VAVPASAAASPGISRGPATGVSIIDADRQAGKESLQVMCEAGVAAMFVPGTEGYTASKGGIVALTHGMAISLARHRIRVNSISSGWIEVGNWQKAAKARKLHHSKADREQHPAGRVGVPEDVAEACQFIAEDAGFMTRQNLALDGGMTVKMIYV